MLPFFCVTCLLISVSVYFIHFFCSKLHCTFSSHIKCKFPPQNRSLTDTKVWLIRPAPKPSSSSSERKTVPISQDILKSKDKIPCLHCSNEDNVGSSMISFTKQVSIPTSTGAEFYYSAGSERSEFLEQPVNSACPRAPARTPPDTGQL